VTGWDNTISGLLTALGIGLLIGVVREHREPEGPIMAGVRTHALAAILAAVAIGFGLWALLAVLVLTGTLATASYLRTAPDDPGLTSEIALLVTAMLAALARFEPTIAVALAVVAALLVYAKRPLEHLARRVISPREVADALLLAAAALVVLPFLPDQPVDPWGVLVPATLWRLVVLVMAVGMLGHVAVRLVGGRRGLLLAGFFAGFASSTAAVAGFGQRARSQPEQRPIAVAAALLANLASLLLFVAVIFAGSPALLQRLAWPLAAAAAVLLAAGLLAWRRDRGGMDTVEPAASSAFRLSHALLFAAVIAVVLLASTLLQRVLGDAGAIAAPMAAALVELHAGAASIAQLDAVGALAPDSARWGTIGLLAASAVGKSVVAFTSGDRRYALGVAAGLLAMVAAAAVAALVA
jgi:uncharacterized membrane protein (DUF4010 family)